jgi:hypothetical protein
MLQEESESFSKTGGIGKTKGLQMNINLTDLIPVQKTYTAVPQPLYPEVKQYVQNLFMGGGVRGHNQPILYQLSACERKMGKI